MFARFLDIIKRNDKINSLQVNKKSKSYREKAEGNQG